MEELEDALAEVQESLQPGRISRIAIDEQGTVLGWIGGIEEYSGNVSGLHPMVVRQDHRMQGVRRALIADFENEDLTQFVWARTTRIAARHFSELIFIRTFLTS